MINCNDFFLKIKVLFILVVSILCMPYQNLIATEIFITDEKGNPLDKVMVTIRPKSMSKAGTKDNGYPQPGLKEMISEELTKFTKNGRITINYPKSLPNSHNLDLVVRAQKIGYKDVKWEPVIGNSFRAKMETISDPQKLINQYPSNAWLAALEWEGNEEHKKVFLEQCGFCHQQGSATLRVNRSEEEWREIINRMIGYGSRPKGESQKVLPALLSGMYKELLDQPEKVKPPKPWGREVDTTTIREWQLGDSYSQMHDLLAHINGKIYVGDNLQDRIWELNPDTGENVVHRVPFQDGDSLGGLLSGRLKTFPKHETYVGVHSLAESKSDGHIFITPSLQRRIIEFIPDTGEFIDHEFSNGLYPHTIRIDKDDRVWYTLALSNQIGMFDRKTKKFYTYDLPPRSKKEAFNLFISPLIRVLMNLGFPMHWLPVDERVTGMPLPYGIDTSVDGKIWFARLHADSIGFIDTTASENPEEFHPVMIETPFQSPRRLRTDNQGNVWIGAFSEGAIYKYSPNNKNFKSYSMPTAINGVETPYSLNVNRKTNQVWATGTQSDTLAVMDIATEKWKVYPMPRKVTFTRDVEFSLDGKKAYTCNGAFPGWQIEDGQPTLIEITP